MTHGKKYGEYNIHNCIDEISHRYTVHRPNSYSLLMSFIELEKNIQREYFFNTTESRFKDLLGARYMHSIDQVSGIKNNFNLDIHCKRAIR